jgi:hypothetical protein
MSTFGETETSSGTETSWFAKDIGKVKFTSQYIYEGGAETEGPYTLEEARINGINYNF